MRAGALLVLLVLTGCATPGTETAAPPDEPRPIAHAVRATLHTSAGDVTFELAREQTPVAVEHFLSFARSGFYDGTRIHRVWQGALLQAGDPNSRGDDRATWGYGGVDLAAPAPVEMNPTLRHDARGAVALAGASGGSQFYVTLAPMPQLDDRFPVFARVADGMDVLERIAAAPNVGDAIDGQPVAPVAIERITIEEPAPAPRQRAVALVPLATTGLAALGGERTVEPGAAATFALVVRNLGDVRENFTLAARHGAGWRVAFERERVELAAGMGAVVLVDVTPPAEGAEAVVGVVATPEGESARAADAVLLVRVADLGDPPRAGQRVRVDYALVTADGRLVDSTVERFDRANVLPPLRAFGPRASYAPYDFTLGDGSVLAAFDALVARTPVGGASVARVPAGEGYPDEPLRGRDLVFEVRVLPQP